MTQTILFPGQIARMKIKTLGHHHVSMLLGTPYSFKISQPSTPDR